MDKVAEFRAFNRFHTRMVGALDEHLLSSPYRLPQIRVLYELAHAPSDAPLSARDLSAALGVDAGYLSRLVNDLVKDGLIQRTPSEQNAKRLALPLTAKGREVFDGLDHASSVQAAAVLDKLSDAEQRELVDAMGRIRRLLGDVPQERTTLLRDPEPGDLGWIISAHGRLYAREYGWDRSFEGLVAEIVGDFAKTCDPARDRCWVAEIDGEIVGSIFVMRHDAETAKLRLLYVDEGARGLGLGQRLVNEAIRFARSRGYKRMTLWTNDVLVSARRIYVAAGFELLEETPHRSFGKDLVGQVWGRDL